MGKQEEFAVADSINIVNDYEVVMFSVFGYDEFSIFEEYLIAIAAFPLLELTRPVYNCCITIFKR